MIEKLTVFALEEGSGEYKIEDDFDKLKDFKDKFAYAFILQYSSQMKKLANRLKDIKHAIDILEEWKNESFFKANETTYEIDWFNSRYKKERTKVTLAQAKKLYKETKLQYDTLLDVINEMYRVHGKDRDGTVHDPKEFLTEIEF